MYCIQKYLWNPDKTTAVGTRESQTGLCISFKLFIEILIKQPFYFALIIVWVVYILQIVHWNPDKTTKGGASCHGGVLCISFKLFIEILIKQQVSWLSLLSMVVYILRIVHWNPDKTTFGKRSHSLSGLCISFELFIEILIKQHSCFRWGENDCCVYPSNCSLKSW